MNIMNSAFTVLPMNYNFYLIPGNTYTGSITIANPSDATDNFSYQISITPYSVNSENYQDDIGTISDFSQITNWITVPEPTGTLAPNEKREVNFTIDVPTDAPAGGQYATILVSSDPTKQNSAGISIDSTFALASIIYANVEGETIHSGSIIDNNIPTFSTNVPINISATLENNGNVHETAIFAITVTNNITGEKIFPNDKDQNNHFSEIIMPKTTRFITRQINDLPAIGSIKVEQTIYYDNETSTITKDVTIMPIWSIFLIVFAIASLVILITLKFKRHHRKKVTQPDTL